MNEETIKMLNAINDKVKRCIKDNNVDTLFAIPLGGHGEFGYLTDKMLNEIIKLQQGNQQLKEKINKVIEYIKGSYEMACYTKSICLEQEQIEELLEILS